MNAHERYSLHSSTAIAASALCIEAGLAQNWSATFLDWAMLEWDLASGSALCACGIVHLSLGHPLRLAVIAAILASLWATKITGRIELLFTVCEDECLPAVAAC